MIPADKESQEKIIELLKKKVKGVHIDHDLKNVEEFSQHITQRMVKGMGVRPWLMKLFMMCFRVVAYFHERRLSQLRDASAAQAERVKRYRFASIFGAVANAEQRAWVAEQITQFNIDFFDAPFLVWSRTLNFKRRRIYFGHWDWIVGIFSMTPLFALVLSAACTCMCACLTPQVKALAVTYYLAEIVFIFNIYKAQSFDVFKVGSKYFKPNGLKLSPLIPVENAR